MQRRLCRDAARPDLEHGITIFLRREEIFGMAMFENLSKRLEGS